MKKNELFKSGEKHSLSMTVPGSNERSILLTACCGKEEGKSLFISSGVHGCEYVGIEALRRLIREIEPEHIRGNLLMLPLLNSGGFYKGLKQLMPEDGKNLNRVFPGDEHGSYSERLAALIENELYPHADFWLDLHGGDIQEELQPLVFYSVEGSDSVNKASLSAARSLSVPYRVQSHAKNGLYSHAVQRGIPALLLERGSRGEWSEAEVKSELLDIISLMKKLDIITDASPDEKRLLARLGLADEAADKSSSSYAGSQQRDISNAVYIDSEIECLWYPKIRLHDKLEPGTVLGELREFDGSLIKELRSEFSGIVMYYSLSLGVEKGSPLIAYAEI